MATSKTKSQSKTQSKPKAKPESQSRASLIDQIKEMVVAKKKGAYLIDIAEALGSSVGKVYSAVISQQGINAGLSSDRIVVKFATESNGPVFKVPTKPKEEVTIGVLSDLHFGSQWCATEQIGIEIQRHYDLGARLVLLPGDLLDGIYHHSRYEVAAAGLDLQAHEMAAKLPKLDGLRYLAITGNHDQTFAASCGVNVGRYLESVFGDCGRSDLKVIGQRSGYVKVGSTIIHMWHPTGSPSYAISYKLQKKIEGYEPGCKPDILLTGHWHKQGYVQSRGVHGFACPSMQFGGSDFGNSLVGDSTVGGLVLKIRTDETGVHDLQVSFRNYYRKQDLFVVRDKTRSTLIDRDV